MEWLGIQHVRSGSTLQPMKAIAIVLFLIGIAWAALILTLDLSFGLNGGERLLALGAVFFIKWAVNCWSDDT